MIYLIVGLGNPGGEYEKTRHNVGFMVLDKLAQKVNSENFTAVKKHKGEIAKTRIGESEVILLKPQTYMNLSGESLGSVMAYYKIEGKNTIVIADDANLELGQVRIRFSGEAGGHKGLGSAISHAGSDFWRVRVGIGGSGQVPLEDYVLQKFTSDEEKIIKDAIDKTVSSLIESISERELENKTIN